MQPSLYWQKEKKKKKASLKSRLHLIKRRSPSLLEVESGLESRSPNFSSGIDNKSAVHKLGKIDSNQNKRIFKNYFISFRI